MCIILKTQEQKLNNIHERIKTYPENIKGILEEKYEKIIYMQQFAMQFSAFPDKRYRMYALLDDANEEIENLQKWMNINRPQDFMIDIPFDDFNRASFIVCSSSIGIGSGNSLSQFSK